MALDYEMGLWNLWPLVAFPVGGEAVGDPAVPWTYQRELSLCAVGCEVSYVTGKHVCLNQRECTESHLCFEPTLLVRMELREMS